MSPKKISSIASILILLLISFSFAGTKVDYLYYSDGNQLDQLVVNGADLDSDGLSDARENTTCTDPNNADTDNDGIPDGTEDANKNGIVDFGETDPCLSDTDGDGISDFGEINTYGTNPYIADTDGDGINDGDELSYWGDNWNQDIDGDGTINLLDNDSDNDGFLDGDEINAGYNPGFPTSIPVPTVTFWAEPLIISSGETATLQWTTKDVSYVFIDQGIGAVDLNGSISVSPVETTSYKITATGTFGTVTSEVTIVVMLPPSKLSSNDSIIGVSISGDFAIVGAPLFSDPDNPGRGAAYIYQRYGSGWVLRQRLLADDGDRSDAYSNDHFGMSVCIDGDYIVVGAPMDDPNYPQPFSPRTGAAYIFKRESEGSHWVQKAKITASDGFYEDYFGHSVSISGDTIIVGAHGHEYYSLPDRGAAYIFVKGYDDTVWVEQAKLTADDGEDYDEFGYSVSIDGDYAIVGAWSANLCIMDDCLYDLGAAYIFKRDGTSWVQQAKFMGIVESYFGCSVSISGDYAIVGSYYDDDGGNNSGSAFIYKRDGTLWSEEAKINASDAAAGDQFGVSVSISGDYAVVGANGDDDAGTDSGSAYIFKREGTTWTQHSKLVAEEGAAGDWFGYSAFIRDGRLIVGTGFEISCFEYEGETYCGPASGTGSGNYAMISSLVNVTLDANPDEILFGESTTLTWTSNFADTVEIDNGIGSVDVNGSMQVSPDETTTYTIMAMNQDVSITSSKTVTVIYPEPTVGITAEPTTILIGESATLSWSSADADSVTIDNGIGSVYANGSISVSPTQTTIYTIFATGRGGTATSSVEVRVLDPNNPPNVNMSAVPTTILSGESTTLTWNSDNAFSCEIDQGIGGVDLNGSLSVSPTTTTPYTITATGPGGTAISTVAVTVNYLPPTVSIDTDLTTIMSGETATLTWDSTNADSATIDNGIGSVAVDGSMAVAPTQTTTYTISVQGLGGSAEDTVTVTVSQPSTVTKITASDASALSKFGNSISVSGDYAVVGAPGDTYSANTNGAAYIFKNEGTTWVQQAKLTASDGAFGDEFGMSVCISGDYVVVGAPGDYNSKGSAYIFKRNGISWTQLVKLTDSYGEYEDHFGHSVSISGTTVIVGAYGDGTKSRGSAFIFVGDTFWTQQAKLTANNAADYDNFGYSVSIDGDYAIIGAWDADICIMDICSYDLGAAYIFKREGTSWSQQTKLMANYSAEEDYFGCSVSISGDYAIVGSYYDDDEGNNSGSAFIYKRDGTAWTQEAKINASDAAAGDQFGTSVSINGDYAIVGASYDDDMGSDSGSAYIFKRNGTNWTQLDKLTADDGAAGDWFGSSVCITDGLTIIGAKGDQDAGVWTGSAYIYPVQ